MDNQSLSHSRYNCMYHIVFIPKYHKNPNAQTDKRFVLSRDSFGSSIAPLLISGYAQIDLVDIRYIHPDYLGQFIDFEGGDAVFV